jgi:hypothetical protein
MRLSVGTYANGDVFINVDRVSLVFDRLELAGTRRDIAETLQWKALLYGLSFEPEQLEVLARKTLQAIE